VRQPAPRERPQRTPAAAAAVGEAAHGQTMIYSTAARVGGAVEEAQARRPAPRAMLAVGGRRMLIGPSGALVGRSRECDIVLEDAGVSRRHAEIRPGREGWTITDLGSTNGVLVNGSALHGTQTLQPGDRLEMGSTRISFEVR
jgi:hypothetical protein